MTAEKSGVVRKTLIAVVGAIAAIGLMTSTPADESGRTVAATARPDGSIAVAHVRGPEYLRAYADIVGVWTICDGLTRGVRRGQAETREGCFARLEAELVVVAEQVLRCVPELGRAGRDHPRWAFIGLAYNIGWPSACASTAARRFRAGLWLSACDAFLPWHKAGRPLRPIPGLLRRRHREREICVTGLTGYPAATMPARVEAWR